MARRVPFAYCMRRGSQPEGIPERQQRENPSPNLTERLKTQADQVLATSYRLQVQFIENELYAIEVSIHNAKTEYALNDAEAAKSFLDKARETWKNVESDIGKAKLAASDADALRAALAALRMDLEALSTQYCCPAPPPSSSD